MSNPSCVVIDYDIGNVFSVSHALKSLGAEVDLTRDPGKIRDADRLILPGVGAFGRAAEKLRSYGLDDLILEYLNTERPFLGICVGMQLLMEKSTEFGEHKGLGVFSGSVEKIDIDDSSGAKLRVPVIGWWALDPPVGMSSDHWANSPLDGANQKMAYYFVHSYAVCPDSPCEVLATVNHGDQAVVAAIKRDSTVGVQFHPERSGPAGLAFLQSFLRL